MAASQAYLCTNLGILEKFSPFSDNEESMKNIFELVTYLSCTSMNSVPLNSVLLFQFLFFEKFSYSATWLTSNTYCLLLFISIPKMKSFSSTFENETKQKSKNNNDEIGTVFSIHHTFARCAQLQSLEFWWWFFFVSLSHNFLHFMKRQFTIPNIVYDSRNMRQFYRISLISVSMWQ